MVVAATELVPWVGQLLVRHGADATEAAHVAAALVWADQVGRANQGVSRLEILVRRLRSGAIRSPCQATSTRPGPGVIHVDGGGGFGHHLATVAMRSVIETAGSQGIAMATVADSNYFGAAGYYAWLAAEAGMVGIAMSNSFAKVAAHGGTRPVLGTNPLAVAAPRADGRHLLLDMATAASAGSSVRELAASGGSLPAGTAVTPDGQPLTDPQRLSEGALLPFGGARGYGLAVVVEVLSGVLTGAGIGPEVGSMYRDMDRGGDNGHFLLAIDVAGIMGSDAFDARLGRLMAMLRTSASSEGGAVRYPGEARWSVMERQRRDGIELSDGTRASLQRLAADVSLRLP